MTNALLDSVLIACAMGEVRRVDEVALLSRAAASAMLDPRSDYRSEDVVQNLEATCAVVGYPKSIRVDQASEFISRDHDLWTSGAKTSRLAAMVRPVPSQKPGRKPGR